MKVFNCELKERKNSLIAKEKRERKEKMLGDWWVARIQRLLQRKTNCQHCAVVVFSLHVLAHPFLILLNTAPVHSGSKRTLSCTDSTILTNSPIVAISYVSCQRHLFTFTKLLKADASEFGV